MSTRRQLAKARFANQGPNPYHSYCSVVGCKRKVLCIGRWCRAHHKRLSMVGSAYTTGLRPKQRTPFVRACLVYLNQLVQKEDLNTVLALRELSDLMNSVSPIPPWSIRGKTPKEKALNILSTIHKQGHFCAREVLAMCLGTELCIKATPTVDKSEGFRKTQVSHAIYHLLKKEIRVYETEHSRTGQIIRTVLQGKERMQSRHVALRLFQYVWPIYRYLLEDHVARLLKFKTMRDKCGFRYQRPWLRLKSPYLPRPRKRRIYRA